MHPVHLLFIPPLLAGRTVAIDKKVRVGIVVPMAT